MDLAPRKLTRSFSVTNWKPSDNQGHSGAAPTWKFWRRLSIRSRGHATGKPKVTKRNSDAAVTLSKTDIGEPTLDQGYRPQRLPDVVSEGGHHLPVFSANAVPPPKPPRLFLPKTISNAGSRSSSAESISEEDENKLNNNNQLTNSGSPNQWHLLDSDDFTLETRQALGGHIISSSINSTHYDPTQHTSKSIADYAISPTHLTGVVEEDREIQRIETDNGLYTLPEIKTTLAPNFSSHYSRLDMGNSMIPVCTIHEDNTVTNVPDIICENNGIVPTTTTTTSDATTNDNDIDPLYSKINNNNVIIPSSSAGTAPLPPSSQPPPLPSSPKLSPTRARNVSGNKLIYNQYHQNGFGTVPRKPKIVTPELTQKRYRRPRSRKLSSCDDQVSRQWRIMTSVLDLMCQRLDPYPLLDPLKRSGVLTNIQLQSFLGGHCDRRSICEGLVDIIGKGTPKCLSVFSAAISACPGNCTEILEILQAMREIDRLLYDIPEHKPQLGADSAQQNELTTSTTTTNSSTTSTPSTRKPPTTISTTGVSIASVSSTTATAALTEGKILNFDIGYLSTDYSLKPLVELDRVRGNTSVGTGCHSGAGGSGIGGGGGSSGSSTMIGGGIGGSVGRVGGSGWSGNSGGIGNSSGGGGGGGGDGCGSNGSTTNVGGNGRSGGGMYSHSRTYSMVSSYSLMDGSLGSTMTLDKSGCSYGGNNGQTSQFHGLVMMSVVINGHNLGGERCKALVDVIRTHNCISELHLGKTNLSGQEVTMITQALSSEDSSSTCHTLDLRLNAVDDVGAHGISTLLRQTRFLRVLNLSSTELSSSDFQEVVSAISGNKSLAELDGSFLDISDDCCVGVRDMLRANSHLQKLRLRGNNLTFVGCESLCQGLAKNVTLSVLDLSRNSIGNAGAEALALYLPDSQVTEVYIDGCGITSQGGQALAELVSGCKRLRHLDVSTNDLQDGGVSRMAGAFERTSSLLTVSLNMCSVTNDGYCKILDAIEKNTSVLRLKLCYNRIGKEEPTNPTASSENLRYRQRIVLSSRPKLRIILWGNAFDDSK